VEFALSRAIEHRRLRSEVKQLREVVKRSQSLGEMLGESQAIQSVFQLVETVADSGTTILVTGESGTGKELVARAIHARGPRRDRPFVALNCAAMPVTLLESELFGHVRGAFTDARRDRPGLFVQASGGTLFLDEIGDMPMEMQAKLLRVLQERKVRPVGSDKEIPFDVRLITATNRDLESDIEQGRFRSDLYFRVNVVAIDLPPLRARNRDVLILAQSFLERAALRLDKAVKDISQAAAQRLLDYDWPGNVRELENCIERAVTLTKFSQIAVEDLPERIREHRSERFVIDATDPASLLSLAEVELRYIQRVLAAVGGNKSRAAKILGLDRRSLYRRIAPASSGDEQAK
jgi:DNA-binding NtrC family response regulator